MKTISKTLMYCVYAWARILRQSSEWTLCHSTQVLCRTRMLVEGNVDDEESKKRMSIIRQVAVLVF